MARQFREQLEEEVQLEEARKTQRAAAAAAPPPQPSPDPEPTPPAAADSAAPPAPVPVIEPELPPLPPTYSHAHPTDATGADPTAARPAVSPGADERGT